jgi:hypothetical protein
MHLTLAEKQVQLMKAEHELKHLRERCRKWLSHWWGCQRTAVPPESDGKGKIPIRLDWDQLKASHLVKHLCSFQHSSALEQVGMTAALAELTRKHRRLEGTSPVPPRSKNALTLVVWNLAAIVAVKLWQYRECVLGSFDEELFDGVIVVRVSDVVPVWAWEADALRNRPSLMDVCNRMMCMELYEYRRRCKQLTLAEKQLLRDQEPYMTAMGLRWKEAARARPALLPSSARVPPSVARPQASDRIQQLLQSVSLSNDSILISNAMATPNNNANPHRSSSNSASSSSSSSGSSGSSSTTTSRSSVSRSKLASRDSRQAPTPVAVIPSKPSRSASAHIIDASDASDQGEDDDGEDNAHEDEDDQEEDGNDDSQHPDESNSDPDSDDSNSSSNSSSDHTSSSDTHGTSALISHSSTPNRISATASKSSLHRSSVLPARRMRLTVESSPPMHASTALPITRPALPAARIRLREPLTSITDSASPQRRAKVAKHDNAVEQ